MKRSIAVLIIVLVFSAFTACGTDTTLTPPTPPPVVDPPPAVDPPPPVITNTVDFSCLSVDNDQICSGMKEDSGIWNSGPVAISGDPMPVDYVNLIFTNESEVDVSVFAYSLVTITGCGDNPIAFDVADLIPGESAEFHYKLWNYRCGELGFQATEISIFNAAGFDPGDYPNPWTYPRNDLITNAVVRWENRLHSDMP